MNSLLIESIRKVLDQILIHLTFIMISLILCLEYLHSYKKKN